MRRFKWLRLLALLAAFGLVAAACSDDSDDSSSTTVTADGDGASGDGLVVGHIGPETGPLAFLGPPQFVGVATAVQDINDAGGVLGSDLTLLTGDEAGDEQIASEGAARLLGEGANAIVGAASSGMSQAFIQSLSDAGIPQCSPSNTSPAFTDQENADFYFRTVPPDEAVTPVIVDTVVADGGDTVAVIARADDYGNALADLLESGLADSGATVTKITYDPDAASFDAEIEQALGAGANAYVMVSFDEGGKIIAGLLEGGATADQMYGGDGVFAPTLPELVDPSDPNVVDGLKVIGAAGGEEFNSRIEDEVAGNYIYGGQAYDCVIVLGLAATAAGSVDGPAIIDAIGDVTGGGTECTDYAECVGLLDDGEDIDYVGASGPLDLDDAGDPGFGRYAIGEFQDGSLKIVGSQDIDVASLG